MLRVWEVRPVDVLLRLGFRHVGMVVPESERLCLTSNARGLGLILVCGAYTLCCADAVGATFKVDNLGKGMRLGRPCAVCICLVDSFPLRCKRLS